jgi:hypothetical protein
MEQEKNYTLYEIFLEDSNEVFYVGITTAHLLQRLGHHMCYTKKDSGQQMRKFLTSCFDKGVKFNIRAVKKGINKRDALDEEKILINKHRNNPVFFNIAGNINKSSKQCYPIYQISMDTLEIVKKYPSIRSTKFDGFTPSNIGRVCRKQAIYADGFYWCFVENYENFVPKELTLFRRSVEELDENGNVIRGFANIKDAALFHNVTSTAVCRWIAKGVKSKMNWRYSSKGYAQKVRIPKKYSYVEIYDRNNNLVNTTTNIMEYCADNNIDPSSVYKALKKGYYVKDLLFKPVIQ